MDSHDYFLDMNLQIEELRLQDMYVPLRVPNSVVPIEYKHRSWLSTQCKHCGEEFETKEKAATHRKNCASNELRSFPCLQEGCGYSAKSFSDYQKHERKHATSAYRRFLTAKASTTIRSFTTPHRRLFGMLALQKAVWSQEYSRQTHAQPSCLPSR
jgi:hypothetical protein